MSESACEEIVSFKQPPLVEVVCGVQFRALPLQTAHFGKFWDRMGDDYPVTRDAPPLPPILEAPPGGGGAFTSISWSDLPELRRVFLVDSVRGRLIQLQADRFHYNWQRTRDAGEYPRFGEVFAEFQRSWGAFTEFVHGEKLGELNRVQHELTYINHIRLDGGSDVPTLGQLLPWFAPTNNSVASAPEPEVTLHYEVPEIAGRLHVSIRSGRRAGDNARVLLMELTARGAGGDIGAWFSDARARIVRSFAALTGPDAHEKWGRTR
jgi:uncharacterized protein (TIGR04255 family)